MNPQHAAELIAKHLLPQERSQILRQEFDWEPGTYTKIQGALALIPFKGYVTTNYDPGLQHAIQELVRDRHLDATSHLHATRLVGWRKGSVFNSGRVSLAAYPRRGQRADEGRLRPQELSSR